MNNNLILQSKIAEGGQNYIFEARDIITNDVYALKAAKSHLNPRYYQLLKKEYNLMTSELKGLDCVI